MASPLTNFNKTRIAPTPSGFLHAGNILSFSITAALAQKTGAKILLRIDDIDQTRANKEYIQDIFDTLNFLGIPWDEGPQNAEEFEKSYSQMHRLKLYDTAFDSLYNKGLVFACSCSRSQLNTPGYQCSCDKQIAPADTKDVSWRLLTDSGRLVEVKSYTGEILKANLPPEMHNFIIKRRDGLPAYQLTSVIDDLFYNIDFVVRGQDLWPSTLAQHYLASVLGEDKFSNITFHHHPLLMGPGGKKLSKSAGATSVKYMREQGHTATTVFMLIAGMLDINAPVNNWQQLIEAIASTETGQYYSF